MLQSNVANVANVASNILQHLVFQAWRVKVRVFKVGETEFKVWKTDFRGFEPELKGFTPQKGAEPPKEGFWFLEGFKWSIDHFWWFQSIYRCFLPLYRCLNRLSTCSGWHVTLKNIIERKLFKIQSINRCSCTAVPTARGNFIQYFPTYRWNRYSTTTINRLNFK